MASRESLFLGIDVSKQTLDVAFGADPHAQSPAQRWTTCTFYLPLLTGRSIMRRR